MSSKIVVDGDSCPVKAEIIEIAGQFGFPVLMVSSFDHVLKEAPGVEVVQVDRSQQSADLYIVNHIRRGDIVVTQDFGLAALVLAKACQAISPRGDIFHAGNIDYLLERRHVQAKARRSGKHSRGPSPFSEEDRRDFRSNLINLLRDLQENV